MTWKIKLLRKYLITILFSISFTHFEGVAISQKRTQSHSLAAKALVSPAPDRQGGPEGLRSEVKSRGQVVRPVVEVDPPAEGVGPRGTEAALEQRHVKVGSWVA